LNLKPELFHSILFAGTILYKTLIPTTGAPFRGGPGLVEDLHWGAVDGRNRDIAGPDVSLTFPSVYQIAQDVDHGHTLDAEYTGLIDEEGNTLPMDWYSGIWKVT
jgi:hypothetical protein